MAGESDGLNIGGITGTVVIDTSSVMSGLDRLHGGLTRASAATDKLVSSASAVGSAMGGAAPPASSAASAVATYAVATDKATSAAARFARQVHDAHAAVIPFADTQGRALQEWLKTSMAMDQVEVRTRRVTAATHSLGTVMTAQARIGAKSRLGLGVANMLQDTIQGGSPAYAINNVLGMAGDTGVKTLIGESVAAAGGVAFLTTAFATMAAGAGAAFLIINSGLKSAKLDWSDFGTVVGNLAPFSAAGEAWTGFFDTVAHSGLGTILDETWKGIKNGAGWIADVTLGWTGATVEAKAHKDEVVAAGKAIREAAEAQKALAKFKSDEQKEKERRGDLIGKALAAMGGDGGVEAVVDRIARRMTAANGDEEVEQEFVDEKGETQKRKITRRDLKKEQIRADMALATEQGNMAGLDRLGPLLGPAGFDTTGLNAARQGRDLKAEANEKIRREIDIENESIKQGSEAGAEADKQKEATNKQVADDMDDEFKSAKRANERDAAETRRVNARDEAGANKSTRERDRAARALMSPERRKRLTRLENLAKANAPVPGRDDMEYDPAAPVPGRAGFAGAEMPGVAGAVPGGDGTMSKADVEKMLGYLDKIAGNTDDLGDLGGFQ